MCSPGQISPTSSREKSVLVQAGADGNCREFDGSGNCEEPKSGQSHLPKDDSSSTSKTTGPGSLGRGLQDKRLPQCGCQEGDQCDLNSYQDQTSFGSDCHGPKQDPDSAIPGQPSEATSPEFAMIHSNDDGPADVDTAQRLMRARHPESRSWRYSPGTSWPSRAFAWRVTLRKASLDGRCSAAPFTGKLPVTIPAWLGEPTHFLLSREANSIASTTCSWQSCQDCENFKDYLHESSCCISRFLASAPPRRRSSTSWWPRFTVLRERRKRSSPVGCSTEEPSTSPTATTTAIAGSFWK